MELALSVEEGVCEAVPVPDCVGEADIVPVPVCVGEFELLKDALPLMEALAPVVREAVRLTESVVLPLKVEVGVGGGVPLLVTVGELEGVPVPLVEAVAELLRELLPVFEDEAPAVSDAVGEADCVLLPLSVPLAVFEPVPVLEGVAVPVGELVGLCVPVDDALKEPLPLFEADAPALIDAVGLADSVELRLAVEVVLPVPVTLPLPLCVPVAEPLTPPPVTEGEVVPLADAAGLLPPDPHALGVALPAPLIDSVGEAVALGVPEAEAPSEPY